MKPNSPALFNVTLEITKKCPLNCSICSSNGGVPYANELSRDMLERIIEDSHELGAKTVVFSGGEPFEHPDLIELCEHAKNLDLEVCIYTSGNASGWNNSIEPIDKKTLSHLKKISIDKLIFGLQGPDDKVHDLITEVHGSFKNAILSMKRAKAQFIETEIHFVPVKPNYMFLPKMIMLAKSLQVNVISVLRFVAQGRGKVNNNVLRLDPHDLVILKSMLQEMVAFKKPTVRTGSPFNTFGFFGENHCTAGKSRATIRADGFVFPCEAMKELPCYPDNNLHEKTLKEIWERSVIFEESRRFERFIMESTCRNCEIFARCRGGCPAQRLISGGSIKNSTDPYCLAREVVAENV
jgi:radical SAM protein with 4Fe4S-binding SPASM domain